MNYRLDVDEKTRVNLDDWNNSVAIGLQARNSADAVWGYTNGAVLSKDACQKLALMLLEKSGNEHVLMKKFRSES